MMYDISEKDSFPGYIYGLIASDEPLQIRYVGKCEQSPFHRLRDHLRLRTRNPAFRDWVNQVRGRGAEVRMRVLGAYPVESLAKMELKWIGFWYEYCQLLNVMLHKPRCFLPYRVSE